MIDFLSGAVTLAYFLAGLFFLRFWRKTKERLFLHFAIAFWLFMLNQVAVSIAEASDEQSGYYYVLRVLGFTLILFSILDKNFLPKRR